MRQKLLIFSLFCFCSVLVYAPAVRAIASIGHFDDTSWNGLDAGYNDISVDITVEAWGGGSDAYYYSNNAYLTSGKNIYGGIQTNGYDGSGWVGKMAIFSIWDTSSGIADPGGTATPFGGEGNGFSVRMPYNWIVGTSYRFKMYIDQDASSGNRLWGASITNLKTNQTTRIGRIYAPVSYGNIKSPVTFHERYIGGTNACSEISASQVRFANLTANNGSVSSGTWNHYVQKNLAECPNLIWVQDSGNGYVSGIATAKPTQNPVAPTPSTPPSTSMSATQLTPQTPVQPTPVTEDVVTIQVVPEDKRATSTDSAKKRPIWLLILVLLFILVDAAALVFVLYVVYMYKKHHKLPLKHFPFS